MLEEDVSQSFTNIELWEEVEGSAYEVISCSQKLGIDAIASQAKAHLFARLLDEDRPKVHGRGSSQAECTIDKLVYRNK